MSYISSLDPATNSTLQIKLYKNVRNTVQLRKKIMDGTLQCCIIKPSLILDQFQIVVAANKALLAEKLITKTVFTEILFNLSISKNISQSLQNFGIHDDDKNIVVAVIKNNETEHTNEAFESVDGDEVDISALSDLANTTAIRKAYKITDVEYKEFSLLDSVVSRIAAKEILTSS